MILYAILLVCMVVSINWELYRINSYKKTIQDILNLNLKNCTWIPINLLKMSELDPLLDIVKHKVEGQIIEIKIKNNQSL